MAKRFVYCTMSQRPFVEAVPVEFQYFNGFSLAQKQRCIDSLHTSFLRDHPETRILEVSSKGRDPLGKALSAFNLTIEASGRSVSVECAFQSSKVFESGGPYIDLLNVSSREAKKDERLRESGRVIGFSFEGIKYPTEPKDLFYCWLYMNALSQNSNLLDEACEYNAFTDIEFNPSKQINCQAKAPAAAVGLLRAGKLEQALKSAAAFKDLVYEHQGA